MRVPAVALPLVVTFSHQTIGSFMLMVAPVLAPVLAQRADVSSTLIGAYTSMAYLAAVVGSGLSGWVFSRIGALTTSTICVLLAVIGLGLLLGRNPALLALSALIVGLGYGPLTPASSHVLSARSPPRWKNTILAIKQTGVPVGGTLAGLTMPFLVVTTGWHWGLAIPALLAVAVALALAPGCRSIDAGTPVGERADTPAGTGPPRRWMMVLGSGGFCYAGVQMTLTAFLGLYFVEYIGLSLAGAGAMIAVFQLSGLMMRLVWGAVADRYAARVPFFTLIGLLIFAAVATFLVLARPNASRPVLIAATVVLGIFGNSWTGLYFVEIIRAVRMDQVGRTTGVALMYTFGGVVVVPPTIGLVVMFASYPIAFALIGILGLFGTLAGVAVRRITPNPPAPSH